MISNDNEFSILTRDRLAHGQWTINSRLYRRGDAGLKPGGDQKVLR